MSLRVTIMISPENDKKIRLLQSETIKKTNKSCSYSKCINEMLSGVKK